jgi:hypothetical protein
MGQWGEGEGQKGRPFVLRFSKHAMFQSPSSKPLSPKAALEHVRKLGLRTPAEAVSMIRRERNALSFASARVAKRLTLKEKGR